MVTFVLILLLNFILADKVMADINGQPDGHLSSRKFRVEIEVQGIGNVVLNSDNESTTQNTVYTSYMFNCRRNPAVCRPDTLCDPITGSCRDLYIESDAKSFNP
ncbi:hypothetical protein CHUAL_005270 [Chamberlinius hualienensis]